MAADVQPLLLTVREVSVLLRIQRPKVYDLIKEGILKGFKVGADWRIKRDSVEVLIGSIPVDFFGQNLRAAERDLVESFKEQKAPVKKTKIGMT